MNYFYDKKCTIYSTTKSKVNGSESIAEAVVYSMIPCDFRLGMGSGKSKGVSDTKISRDTSENLYSVDVKPLYTNISKGNRIRLYDVVNGVDVDLGLFEVVSVEVYKDIGGKVDNVYLEVYPRNI